MPEVNKEVQHVAYKIQEALRGVIAAEFHHAVEFAEKLVATHGFNKVDTVDKLKAIAGAELKTVAEKSAVAAVATVLEASTAPQGEDTKSPGPGAADLSKTSGQPVVPNPNPGPAKKMVPASEDADGTVTEESPDPKVVRSTDDMQTEGAGQEAAK